MVRESHGLLWGLIKMYCALVLTTSHNIYTSVRIKYPNELPRYKKRGIAACSLARHYTKPIC